VTHATHGVILSPEKTVVVGLGNRFLRDDAAGIRVAEALKRELRARESPRPEEVRVEEYEEMDLSILQEVEGASRLILVDSMMSGTEPGTVSLFRLAEKSEVMGSMPSLHELDLSDMVYLAQRVGILRCPVLIVGIEPADLSIGEGLSEKVEAAIPLAVREVLSSIGEEARRASSSAST
jgi:hydrogenase maturation protease